MPTVAARRKDWLAKSFHSNARWCVRVACARPESKIGAREGETTSEGGRTKAKRGKQCHTITWQRLIYHSSLAVAIALCYARRVCLKTCPIKMVQLYGRVWRRVERFNKPITITIKFCSALFAHVRAESGAPKPGHTSTQVQTNANETKSDAPSAHN